MHKTSMRKLWLGAGIVALAVGFAAASHADHLSTADTTDDWGEPTPLGVSGGSQTLLQVKALLYCYTGTLGALVQAGGTQFILSNNHVLAKENHELDYGDPAANDTIIQPGNLDQGTCSLASGNHPEDAVADLTDYVPIAFGKGRNKPSNTVDAAIAETISGKVFTDGRILGIGTVFGTATASAGMAVQKTGRTTAHTFGKVEATNVTLDVSYESGTARFVGQIRIRKPCGDAGFSDGGDSGAVIVTAPGPGEDPAAVALLFAGGSSDTFANPIVPVLDSFGVSMVSVSDNTDDGGAMLSDYEAIVAANCPSGSGGGGGKPGGGGGNGHKPHGAGAIGLEIAAEVKARHSDELFALPDVIGHGVGADENDEAVIEIYTASKARRAVGRAFPSALEGIAVRVVETGPVRAY